MTATDLERELDRLAERIEAPVVPVSADLARGRRRLLRHRLVVAGAAAATVAVVGGAAWWGQGTVQSLPDPAERLPDGGRTSEPATQTQPLPALDDRASHADELSVWNDVLAEHLDPRREHLQPYRSRTGNQQTSGGGNGLATLGSRYGWANAGEEGLGMLEVSVSRSRAAWWPCQSGAEAGLTCRDARGPNGEEARVGTSDSVTTVQLVQEDGDVVALTLDLLFGNNSLVPISGSDLTPAQLLEAAADDRLDLPEPPPVSSVDPAQFQRALEEVVGEDREVGGFPSGGQSLFEGGLFDGRRQVAVLTADAFPTDAGYAAPRGCDEQAFTRCERREVDGREVVVGWLRSANFPGVQVVAAGPENVVRLQWERSGADGDEPDVDALVALVADPRWQR